LAQLEIIKHVDDFGNPGFSGKGGFLNRFTLLGSKYFALCKMRAIRIQSLENIQPDLPKRDMLRIAKGNIQSTLCDRV
jgi:hypothetical protein